MNPELRSELIAGLQDGSIVPYLGPGALAGVVSSADGRPMPATSEELILGLNNGQPMAPRLMFEFPRAAMHVELKRGRNALMKFLNATYGGDQWDASPLHDWLADLAPRYIIDANRDALLQRRYAATRHTLVVGIARIAGSAVRYKLYRHDGAAYHAAAEEDIDPAAPILFKPLGTPLPEPAYIASDADFVDYITELMGGFAIPPFLKKLRPGLKYLFLGLPLNRDTERMVMSDIIYGAGEPTGWAFIPAPSDKERRFCARMGIRIIEAEPQAVMGLAAAEA